MNLKATPKQYHIIYRNIAGSMRQTWVTAIQHYAAIEQFKKEYGHLMDPDHSPLNIKEMNNGVCINRWSMDNAYCGLPERRDIVTDAYRTLPEKG
jgi:hypothetical protein